MDPRLTGLTRAISTTTHSRLGGSRHSQRTSYSGAETELRKSTVAILTAVEAGVLAYWAANLTIRTGVDSLQYQRMASAITRDGLAPWVLSPLSYVGFYPGSDSSGVPFLGAMLAMQAQIPVGVAVLLYDLVLLLALGLGLFVFASSLTRSVSVGILSTVMGSLAFGFTTALSWSLDERSFNVALLPAFLFLVLPRETAGLRKYDVRRVALLLVVSAVMLASHLNFLLLIPFIIIVPPLYGVLVSQSRLRMKRVTSIAYFASLVLAPLLIITGLNALGLSTAFGLDYSLSSSAVFSGSSSLVFTLNSIVFLSVRTGPATMICALLGILYLATRPNLSRKNVAVGALLLAGFLGLPIVLYSKDLLTPLMAILGAIGVVAWASHFHRHQVAVLAISGALIAAGSLAFNTWNQARSLQSAAQVIWTPPGVPPEAQGVNLWMSEELPARGCLYGNNIVAVEQVAVEPAMILCGEIPVDYLIRRGTDAVTNGSPIKVLFVGFDGINPNAWFSSPQLDSFSRNLTRLQQLDFASGRILLLAAGVSIVIVALEKPTEIPLYGFGGSTQSSFFNGLWWSEYPVYRSTHYAVFAL